MRLSTRLVCIWWPLLLLEWVGVQWGWKTQRVWEQYITEHGPKAVCSCASGRKMAKYLQPFSPEITDPDDDVMEIRL